MLLEAREVSKRFGERQALASVSVALEEGEHLAVQGPSGSGKTTLLRVLAGLLEPSGGRVLEDGQVVSRPGWCLPPHRRSLGMLFQDLALWPHLRAREQVEFALPPEVEGAAARRRRADAALDECGIAALAGCYPRELSGGERQRLAWARAVAPCPRVLLLDEPLTSLDPRLKEELLQAIVRYGEVPGRTLVFATHDPGLAQRAARRHLAL